MQGNQNAMPQKMSLGAVPKEGPLVVPNFVDFTAFTTYQLDLTYQQQGGRISMIQTLYVDNSNATVPLFITVATSGQTIKIPANSQAYVPLTVTNKLAVSLTSSANLVIPVFVINVAMNATIWSTNNPPATNGSGQLLVSDPALEAGVVSGYFQSEQFVVASGGTIIPQFEGTKAITGALAVTTAVTLFTGAPGFMLTNLQVFASPNAILGAAGIITVTASESTVGNIAQGEAFLPTAVPTGLTPQVQLLNWNGRYSSKASTSSLQLTLSTVPTGGTVYYNATYALTTFVGG